MTHLETYLDVLKLLPNELQRELVLMGELDKKATAVRQEMEAMQEIIIEAASGGATKANADKKNAMGGGANGEPTEAQLLHLRQLQQMLVDLHNEKLALAKQSKDMVVAYASRLDDDIQLFAADLPPEGECRCCNSHAAWHCRSLRWLIGLRFLSASLLLRCSHVSVVRAGQDPFEEPQPLKSTNYSDRHTAVAVQSLSVAVQS